LIIRDVDLTSRLKSFRVSFSFDAGAWTLDLELTNHEELVKAGKGLDPFDPISEYNADGPLLGSYNPVKLIIREPSGYEKVLFTGYIGPLDRTSQETWGEAGTISVSCVGPSQPLKDYYIPEWEALKYEKAIISREGQPDLLNRILIDQGFAPIIRYLDDPCFHVDEYIVGGVSLWEALENALAPTGFRLIERHGRDGLEIVVKDPLRFKTEPDHVLIGDYRTRRISGSEADVRTWVAVVYRDRVDGQEKLVYAEASPETVAKFGVPDGQGGRKHKRMVYKTSERSLVDTESEARELAAMILWDLEYPTPSLEVELPRLAPEFDPFQLVRVVGPVVTIDFGIMEIDWELSWENPYGRTVLRGSTGRVIGAKGLWFAKDTKKVLGRIGDRLARLSDEPCPQPRAPEVHGAWFVQSDGSPKPVIDVFIPETPPFWANGMRVYVWRFRRIDEDAVSSFGSNWISPTAKTYPDQRFGAGYRDYLLLTSGAGKGRGFKIVTTSGNRVYLTPDLPSGVQAGDRFWILRLKDITSFEAGLTNYLRISDVHAGEAIAVSISWIPRGR